MEARKGPPPLRLSLDIETYSPVELAKSGVYRYAESPDFRVLLIGYSVNGGPVEVVDLASGDPLPTGLVNMLLIYNRDLQKWAFNASFERVCLSRLLRDYGYLKEGEYLSPVGWRCSMVWSAYLGLPMSLEQISVQAGYLIANSLVVGLGTLGDMHHQLTALQRPILQQGNTPDGRAAQ